MRPWRRKTNAPGVVSAPESASEFQWMEGEWPRMFAELLEFEEFEELVEYFDNQWW